MAGSPAQPTLARKLTLVGLVATGVCSMIGVAINTIPFTLQRSVPGIGPNVLAAFVIAAIPALLAGLAYAVLASAMPNAGGTYVYASRALNPYLGFAASFSQWLAISVAMGVVSYMLMPFLRDLAIALEWPAVARAFDGGVLRIAIPLALLWTAALREHPRRRDVPADRGAADVPDPRDRRGGDRRGHCCTPTPTSPRRCWRAKVSPFPPHAPPPASRLPLFPAVPVIFSCFIGFDSIAQAGGEAKDPTRNLPLAILISVVGVAIFYLLFTASVYHAVPWTLRRRAFAEAGRDRAGAARVSAAAAVGGAHCRRGVARADQGPAGDADGDLAAALRVGGGRDLPGERRGGASGRVGRRTSRSS